MVLAAPPAIAASCAKGAQVDSSFGDDSGAANTSSGGGPIAVGDSGVPTVGTSTPGGDSGGGFVIPPPTPDAGPGKCNAAKPCDDFPAAPILDPAAPPASDPSALFGPATMGTAAGAPCLVEPQDGALFPKNWLRPRFLWTPTSTAQDLFEVRITTPAEKNPLVIYTKNQFYVMDKGLWATIATGVLDANGELPVGNLVTQTLTVTVRALSSTAPAGTMPAISASSTMTIAPAIADGALVFWSTASFANGNATNTTLQGFRVGDEGTALALQASDVQQPVRAQSIDGGNLMPASFNNVYCIGCHTATPDGQYVSFISQWPWAVALASVQQGTAGAAPPWLTTGAASNLSPNINGYYQPANLSQTMMGIQTYSPSHYTTGDRKMVASLGASWNQTTAQIEAGSPGTPTGVISDLAWFDLEYTGAVPAGTAYNPWGSGVLTSPLPLAQRCSGVGQPAACATSMAPNPGWGIIARTGDMNSAGAPSWSHNVDGQTDVIAYSSTNIGTADGRMDCKANQATCVSDVYVVPYNNGAGGTATPLAGASDPAQNEYYPVFSPDDKLVAFNRVKKGTSMYNEPTAEVWVVPYNGGMGGTAVRLAANDPVACTSGIDPALVAGKVQNTWPKWAPNAVDKNGQPFTQTDDQGNSYYWITFSSTRSPTSPKDAANGGRRRQQLYVAGVVIAADGSIKTYAPIYLWNQNDEVNNLIPSWGEFQVPPGVMPPPPPPPTLVQ